MTATNTEPEVVERLPPGTVRLIDVDGTLNASHAQRDGQQDIVLVPQPSEDPEDPLNWSHKRKLLATACVVVYTIMIAIPSSAVYSVVTPIRTHTELTLQDINNGTGIMFLFYGWGCVIWQPTALQYGKRPVYLFSCLANTIILATAPLCVTSGPYLANRILLGFFGAPVESLCEISITDIWFTHQRAEYLAWYGWALALAGKLAPMMSGFINLGMGWEWTLWWCAIFNAMAFVFCFFLMEETNYDRKHDAVTHRTPSEKQDPAAVTDKEADSKAQSTEARSDSEVGEIQWPRKTYWQKLGIKDKKRPNRIMDMLVAPFIGFTYAPVVYAGLMYGANSLVWTGVQNATIGTVYTTEYGFSTGGVAGGYAGGIVGTIIGGLYCGKVGKMLTLKLARRNGGVSEPEHTLWLFLAGCFLVPFGLILYGLAVTYHLHWFALIFTQSILAINSSLCVAAALNYAISSYPELSGQMVTTCVIIRNTLSFAINFGITPWLQSSGYLQVYCIMGAIGLLWNGSLFIMTTWGRKIRTQTGPKYWRDVDKAKAKGLSH